MDTEKEWRLEKRKNLFWEDDTEVTEDEHLLMIGSLYGIYWAVGTPDQNQTKFILACQKRKFEYDKEQVKEKF